MTKSNTGDFPFTDAVYADTGTSATCPPIVVDWGVPVSEIKRMEDNRMYLFKVHLIYAEDLKKPVHLMREVIAKTNEQAEIKSGLMKEIHEDWDAEYVTIHCESICEVKYKKKPEKVIVEKE